METQPDTYSRETTDTTVLFNATNNTQGEESAEVGTTFDLSLTICATLLGTFIFIANGILLIALLRFKSKHLKHSTHYFLMHKTLVYVIYGLLIASWPHVPLQHCIYFILAGGAALRVMLWGIFLLSLDSFITIIRPYTHKFIMTGRVANALLLLLFLTQVVFILVYLFGNTKPPLRQAHCTTDDGPLGPVALLFHFVMAVLIILLILVMQAYTVYDLWKRSKLVKPLGPNHPVPPTMSHGISVAPRGNPLGNKVKKLPTRLGRLVQLLVVSAICNTLFWLPVIVANTAYYIGLPHMGKPAILKMKKYMGVLHSVDGVLQPCIAIMMSQELRAAVKKLFCKSGVPVL